MLVFCKKCKLFLLRAHLSCPYYQKHKIFLTTVEEVCGEPHLDSLQTDPRKVDPGIPFYYGPTVPCPGFLKR